MHLIRDERPNPNAARPISRLRDIITTLLILAVLASVVLGLTVSNSRPAGALSPDECAQALAYPDRTQAERDWLTQCVSALRPYVAPTGTPSATQSAEPTTPPATSTPTPPVTTTTTTAAPTPTPTVYVPTDTYTVQGRWLFDPLGNRVIPRGVENSMWNVGWLPYSLINEAAKTGANTIRILPFYLKTPSCSGCGKVTVAQIEDMILRGLSSKMLVDIAIDGGDTAVYLRPEIKTLLFKYKSRIVVHARGEAYESTDAAWRDASISAITQMRAAGYTMPLYIMSRQGGRDLRAIINEGAAVVASDPLHNTVLGWQAYWGSGGGYQSNQQMSLAEAMASAASLPFPVQVGLAYRSDPWASSQTIPFEDLMRLAQELSLGWLWWDWRTGADNLTTDGVFGHWATPANSSAPCASPCVPTKALGRLVALDDPNSIANTSVRTQWMLAA